VVVALPVKLACAGQLKPGLVMLGHCLVQQRALGVARVVALGLTGGAWVLCKHTVLCRILLNRAAQQNGPEGPFAVSARGR
jgi:hypothetical protein